MGKAGAAIAPALFNGYVQLFRPYITQKPSLPICRNSDAPRPYPQTTRSFISPVSGDGAPDDAAAGSRGEAADSYDGGANDANANRHPSQIPSRIKREDNTLAIAGDAYSSLSARQKYRQHHSLPDFRP